MCFYCYPRCHIPSQDTETEIAKNSTLVGNIFFYVISNTLSYALSLSILSVPVSQSLLYLISHPSFTVSLSLSLTSVPSSAPLTPNISLHHHLYKPSPSISNPLLQTFRVRFPVRCTVRVGLDSW